MNTGYKIEKDSGVWKTCTECINQIYKLYTMKRLIIILFAALLSCSLFSQKIKIEKKTGVMSIDNVEVVKLKTGEDIKKHLVYIFSDLSSDATLTLTGATPGKQPEYYIVSSSLSDKTSEMVFELVGFTLNPTTAITNLIVKKYQFFSTAGMNQKAISDFLYLEKNDYSKGQTETKNTMQRMQHKVDSLAPIFKSNQVISKNTGELLAVFENINGGFLIKDDRNNVVAKAEEHIQGVGPIKVVTYVLKTFDDKEYELKADELLYSVGV